MVVLTKATNPRGDMAQDDPKTLVSTDWLAAHMKDPDLRREYDLVRTGAPPFPRFPVFSVRSDMNLRMQLRGNQTATCRRTRACWRRALTSRTPCWA